MEQILRRLDDIEYTLQTRLDDIYKLLSSLPNQSVDSSKNEIEELLVQFTDKYLIKHPDYIMSRSAFRSAFLTWIQREDLKVTNALLDDHLGVAKSVSKVVNKDVYELLTLQKTSKQKENLLTIAGWKGMALSKELGIPSMTVTRKRKKMAIKTSDELRQVLQSAGIELSEETLADPALLNEVFTQCTDVDRKKHLTECFELFRYSSKSDESIYNTYMSFMAST